MPPKMLLTLYKMTNNARVIIFQFTGAASVNSSNEFVEPALVSNK